MTASPTGHRYAQLRQAITDFLAERCTTKLGKLTADDPAYAETVAKFAPGVWIEDAARRVRQISAVTHTLKPMHGDAKGSSLPIDPRSLPDHPLVGSHVLGDDFTWDVVGNAAALDVYKFLKLSVDGQSLLAWLQAEDAQALQALSDDPAQAQAWRDAFVSLTEASSILESHGLAKQLYWRVGDDDTDDSHYHLLTPLHPSALQHVMHATLQDDRFGDRNKAARAARREGKAHEAELHDYPQLAVQKLGGTKPQNISQLNSERGGVNYLLASMPPRWQLRSLRQPWGVVSVFDQLVGQRASLRCEVNALRRFLESDPPPNEPTRRQREAHLGIILDEVVLLARELQLGWPQGWSTDPRCQLVRDEQLWLDTARLADDDDFRREWLLMDWPDAIGHRFGNWLNHALGPALGLGEAEHRRWKREWLTDESLEGWAQQLHRVRSQQQAPHDIPTRKSTA